MVSQNVKRVAGQGNRPFSPPELRVVKIHGIAIKGNVLCLPFFLCGRPQDIS